MSILILTEEEKAMGIMDTPDKPLADAVRHCYAIMHTVAEKLDKPVLAVAAQHACVFLAKETNAGSLSYTIKGLTCKDDDLGDWKIEIKRLPAPMPSPLVKEERDLKAELAAAHAEIENIKATLLDPNAVHVNMLRGVIAPIPHHLWLHVAGLTCPPGFVPEEKVQPAPPSEQP